MNVNNNGLTMINAMKIFFYIVFFFIRISIVKDVFFRENNK